MDIKNLIEAFNNKKNTHPVLSALWINYLEFLEKTQNNSILHALTVLECMNTSPDYTIEQLQTIIFLSTQQTLH
jgi:hypothetical protein